MTRRRGTGLPEMLVALALASVVMATASRALVLHLRQQRARDARARADEVVREVHHVLRTQLAHAAGAVRTLDDTAIDVPLHRVVTVACELSVARLVIPAAQDAWSAPRAGDSLAVLDTLTRTEWRIAVTAVGTQRATPQCPAGGTRVTLAAPPPSSVPILRLPVRIWRQVRYVAYRAGDGLWWLGERGCTPACGSAQPVTGPLLPPGQGGLTFLPHLAPDGRTAAVDLTVRADVGGQVAHHSARLPLAGVP